MIVQITGSTNTLPPFDVFLCDSTNTSCFYVSGLTDLNPVVTFNTTDYFPTENFLYLRIVDTKGCIYTTELDCLIGKAFQDGIYFDFMDGVGYYFQQ
jgi:hypothetical protein